MNSEHLDMGKRGEVGWEPCYLHPPKSTKSLSGKHLRRICVIRSRLPGPRAACSRQTETQTPWTNRRAQGAKSGTLVLQEERRRKGQVTVTSDSKGVRRSLEGAQALGSQAQVRVCACAHVCAGVEVRGQLQLLLLRSCPPFVLLWRGSHIETGFLHEC